VALRVLVVGEDPLARSGLAALLSAQPGIEVVAQAPGGGDWPLLLEAYEPDAVVWDVGPGSGPTIDPPASLERIGVPLLALVAEPRQAAEALGAGARSVLLRSASGERLAAAISAAVLGLVTLDEGVADAMRPRPALAAPHESLTPREREVLQLLSLGLANRRIAETLGITERTVKFHVNAILGKLGAQSRTEAVAQAMRLGLVAL
jgi:DNA-binding NarL/FixJ family response regulator